MARAFLISLFCLLAFQLNHFVIGRVVLGKYSLYFKNDAPLPIFLNTTQHNESIDYCEFNHSGIKGIKNFIITEKNNEKVFGWEKIEKGSENMKQCSVFNSHPTNEHYGRYEIKGHSSNGTLLTSDSINLYKQYFIPEDFDEWIMNPTDEYVTLLMEDSEILEICNDPKDEGLCTYKLSINDSQPICKLWRSTSSSSFDSNKWTSKYYYDDADIEQGRVKKTGSCEFEIFNLEQSQDSKFSHWGDLGIDVQYGLLDIKKKLLSFGDYKKIQADVGSNVTIRLNSLKKKNITCLFFGPEDKNFTDMKRISQFHENCEYVINNVQWEDSGFFKIEYVYKNDNNSRHFRQTYFISVYGFGDNYAWIPYMFWGGIFLILFIIFLCLFIIVAIVIVLKKICRKKDSSES